LRRDVIFARRGDRSKLARETFLQNVKVERIALTEMADRYELATRSIVFAERRLLPIRN
jgi:hypothetical protein